jgi:hypothetical protein
VNYIIKLFEDNKNGSYSPGLGRVNGKRQEPSFACTSEEKRSL